MEYLTAHAQYDDWTGTAAADEGQHDGLQHLYRRAGLGDGAFVVAFSYYAGDSGFISLTFVTVDAQSYDNAVAALANKAPLAEHHVEHVSAEEFFRAFKRFNVAVRRKGLDLSAYE